MVSKENQLTNKRGCHSVNICFLLDEVAARRMCLKASMTLIRTLHTIFPQSPAMLNKFIGSKVKENLSDLRSVSTDIQRETQ